MIDEFCLIFFGHSSDILPQVFELKRMFVLTHQNLTSCHLSTALSLETENTALQQILS